MKIRCFALCLFIFSIRSTAQPVKTVLISYYSKTETTKAMAEEVAKGAASVKDVRVIIKPVGQTENKDLLEATAIIIGSPVYNANVAPEVMQFINNWPFEGSPLKDKLGAAFVTAGGISAGEELAQLNLLHSMMVFGMVVLGGENWSSSFGASAITNEAPFIIKNKDIDSLFLNKGYALGKRVAEWVLKLK